MVDTHGGQVGQRIRGGSIAGLNVEPRRSIPSDDLARDRARHDKRRIKLAIRHYAVDLRLGLAEDPHRVAGGFIVAFCRLLIGSSLIDIFLGAAAGFQQLLDPCQRPRLQFEDARGREQRRFRLQQIGTVDRKQGISLVDLVADVEGRIDDPAGVGRERLHQHVLVEIDRSDRVLDDVERPQLGRLDLESCNLLLGEIDILLLDTDVRFRDRLGGLGS